VSLNDNGGENTAAELSAPGTRGDRNGRRLMAGVALQPPVMRFAGVGGLRGQCGQQLFRNFWIIKVSNDAVTIVRVILHE